MFRSSRGLSTAEAHVFGVKFIRPNGLNGTVGFDCYSGLSFWRESDLWSDVWPATDGMVCLSIPLEGVVTISNNLTKRRQNGFKIGTRDTTATHLRKENLISNEIVIYTIFYDRWFFHAILYVHQRCVIWTKYPVPRQTQVNYYKRPRQLKHCLYFC